MFPEERKEGSPRFGKLHFPVGLWINSPKKHLAKMSRRWPSAGSVRSTSSDTPSRGSEPVELRPPGKNKPARHKRLSNLFHRSTSATSNPPAPTGGRWASEKKLAELTDPLPEELGELGQRRQLPGVLKIFGGAISRGANYKSVLATPGSSARQLVREALERYGLEAGGGQEQDFVLCDVVGREGGGAWRVEHLRALGDAERPLVLQDVWQPKAGCSRRFEIRRRRDVDRAAEDDDETAGINAQARRLQKSRSRAASGGPAPAPPPQKDRSANLSLRRSISDMNLSTRRRRERKNVLSLAGGDTETPPGPDEPPPDPPGTEQPPPGAEESGGEEGASLEQLAQCLIQPPQNHPYFIVLRGYGKQDFVLYVMTRPRHIFGRPEKRGGVGGGGGAPPQPPDTKPCGGGSQQVVDTFLNAPDVLPRHCLVRSAEGGAVSEAGGGAWVRPFRGAPVTHNGAPLYRRAPLRPGDLLGLGRHFLLLYKDPRGPGGGEELPPPWLAPPPQISGGPLSCPSCGRAPREDEEEEGGGEEGLELRYRPQDEELLLKEIVRTPGGGAEKPGGGSEEGGGGGSEEGGGVLAPAFLLGLCLERAARALPPERFPKLLAAAAMMVKDTVWEKIKEISERQPENQQEASPGPPSIEEVAAELRPLLLWLANAMELLNLAQGHVLELEQELELEGPGQDPQLAAELEACDEALGVLDEVIMSTFQQSVYYLTKTLYTTLPALLDSNPFSGGGEPSAPQDVAAAPEGVRGTLAVFQAALGLTRACQLHPELTSQTFGYLFFFSNASLFNTLMEKGSAGPFFQWSRAVRVRANLDLVLDWLQGVGLGDVAHHFFQKLSATANLLCTPRSSLSKATWQRLRAEFPALSPAQLHHVLSHYHLGLGRPYPDAWSPPPEERDLVANGAIFESFSEHPPLLLPGGGFRLRRGEAPGDPELLGALRRLRRFLARLQHGDP